MNDDRPMLIFEIYDGGMHWIVARNEIDALTIHASSVDETLESYMIEYKPIVKLYLEDYLIIDVSDEIKIPKWLKFPKGSRVQIKVPRESFKYFEAGCVSTTEY